MGLIYSSLKNGAPGLLFGAPGHHLVRIGARGDSSLIVKLIKKKSAQRICIYKNRRQEVERVAEYKIVPNRHVFISIFGREIKEKTENTVPW